MQDPRELDIQLLDLLVVLADVEESVAVATQAALLLGRKRRRLEEGLQEVRQLETKLEELHWLQELRRRQRKAIGSAWPGLAQYGNSPSQRKEREGEDNAEASEVVERHSRSVDVDGSDDGM